MTEKEAKEVLWQCFYREPDDCKVMKNFCVAYCFSKDKYDRNKGYSDVRTFDDPDLKSWQRTILEFSVKSAITKVELFLDFAEHLSQYREAIDTLLKLGYTWEDDAQNKNSANRENVIP